MPWIWRPALCRDCLKGYLDKGQKGIPREELLGYMRDAAAALDYLHGQKVLHRDVKPDNILLLDGQAKVADFGLLRDQNQTATLNRPVGTPPYMAPEVWACKPEPASEQYSLACAYVELRCGGHRPFPQKTIDDLHKAHVNDAPDLSLLNEAERLVLTQALNKQPALRFASCAEMVQAIEEAGGVPSSPFLPGNRTPVSSPFAETDANGTIKPGTNTGRAASITHVDEKSENPAREPRDWTKKKEQSRSVQMILLGLCCVIGLGGLVYLFWQRPPVDDVDAVAKTDPGKEPGKLPEQQTKLPEQKSEKPAPGPKPAERTAGKKPEERAPKVIQPPPVAVVHKTGRDYLLRKLVTDFNSLPDTAKPHAQLPQHEPPSLQRPGQRPGGKSRLPSRLVAPHLECR